MNRGRQPGFKPEKKVTFPNGEMEFKLASDGIDKGFDKGKATIIARSIDRAVWELALGLAVDEKTALKYIKKTLGG